MIRRGMGPAGPSISIVRALPLRGISGNGPSPWRRRSRTKAGGTGIDEIGLHVHERHVIEPERREVTLRTVGDDDVGLGHEIPHERAAAIARKVDREALLVALRELGARIPRSRRVIVLGADGHGHAEPVTRRQTQRITRRHAQRVDANHLGAEVAE